MKDIKLDMDNEQLIFDIKLFREEKRRYFKNKYPKITERDLLKKLNLCQKNRSIYQKTNHPFFYFKNWALLC